MLSSHDILFVSRVKKKKNKINEKKKKTCNILIK